MDTANTDRNEMMDTMMSGLFGTQAAPNPEAPAPAPAPDPVAKPAEQRPQDDFMSGFAGFDATATPPKEPPTFHQKHLTSSVKREPERFFSPTKNDWGKLKKAFDGDPLAVIDDPAKLIYVRTITGAMRDPETERQKIALAAYFSQMRNGDFGFCYDNLDSVLKAFYGKETGIGEAYRDIGDVINFRQVDHEHPVDRAIRGAAAEIVKGTVAAADVAANGLAFLGKLLFTPDNSELFNLTIALGPEEAQKIYRKEVQTASDLAASIRQGEQNLTGGLRKTAEDLSTLRPDWFTNSKGVADWCGNAMLALIGYLPQLGGQTAVTMTAGPAALGALYGANAYFEYQDENPNASEAEKLYYASLIALINGIGEHITLGIIKGGPAAEQTLKKGISGAIRYFFWNGAKEGGQEFGEETAENLVDILFGRRGDWKKFDTRQWIKELFRGSGEAGVLGTASSILLGIPIFQRYRKNARDLANLRNSAELEIGRLEAKEDLSPEEVRNLELFRRVADTGNLPDAVNLIRRTIIERAAGKNAAADPELAAAAVIERLRAKLPHNPADTIDAVHAIAPNFQTPVVTVDAWSDSELAPLVARQIARREAELGRPLTDEEKNAVKNSVAAGTEAIWTPDGVRINANVVPPSRVPFVLNHEIAVHEGLERAFGKEAKNQLLDAVWEDCEESPLMQDILQRYEFLKADQNGGTVPLDEAQRREAAEEFLANLGETNGVPVRDIYREHRDEIDAWARKHGFDPADPSSQNRTRMVEHWMYDTDFRPERPGWLKQLISRVRLWLRQHGIMVHHLSDDDIQSILARAARAERKKRMGTDGNGGNGSERMDTENGEARFSQQTRPYYQVPFAEGLKRVVDPARKANRDPVYVRDTPEIFRKIGFTALPMMANGRHLRLNYYTADEFEANYGKMRTQEHAHGLHDAISHLPQALEHPLAIVANQTPNAKPGSVVAITDMNVNGKKVVVPVLIEATSSADGARIDSHLVLTVYDENDWIGKFLKPALDAEKKGIGIFYFDKEKAARYSALSKKEGSIPTGFVHNIDDEGSPVKGIFKKQTETLQFRRWFKDSKVVDQDGKPLVVYHGSGTKFWEFKNEFTGIGNDQYGPGFYFTSDRDVAHGYTTRRLNDKVKPGGEDSPTVMPVYLAIRNPIVFDGKNDANLSGVELTAQQAFELMKRCPGILEEDSPIGDFSEEFWENGGSVSLLRKIANRYDWNLETMLGDIFRDNGKAFRNAVHEVLGYDGVKIQFDGQSHWVAWFPTQIKSATDNVGTFDPGNPDIRFSAGREVRSERVSNLLKLVKPILGENSAMSAPEIADALRERFGVEVDPDEAGLLKLEAERDRIIDAFARGRQRRAQWLLDNILPWRQAVDFAGTDRFKIRLSPRMEDQNAAGSFILKKNERFDGAIIDLDRLASDIASRSGRDHLEVEQELFDFFNGLTRRDLEQQYKQWKEEQLFADKEAARAAKEEFMRMEQFRIDDAIVRVIQDGKPVVSPEWIADHKKIWQELRKRVLRKENPSAPSQSDIDTVNAAIAGSTGDLAAYAGGWKDARTKAWEDYQNRLNALYEKVRQEKIDTRALQREAADFAFKHLPKGFREKFISRIIGLSRFGTTPDKVYPEGRRKHEFNRLRDDITAYYAQINKSVMIGRIRELLDHHKSGRTRKNVPFSPMGDRQQALDRISQIVRMSPETAADVGRWQLETMAVVTEQLEHLPDETVAMPEQSAERQRLAARKEALEHDAFYLEHFGALSLKTNAAVERSLRMLDKFITEGKSEFLAKRAADGEYFDDLRMRVRQEMTQQDIPDVPSERELNRTVSTVNDYFYKNESITRMLDYLSGTDNLVDLTNSAAGQMLDHIDRATQTEQSFMNEKQAWFDATLKRCGIKNLLQKGKFINLAMQEQETDIPVQEFGTILGSGNAKYTDWSRGRPKQTLPMHVEHAAKMLEDIHSKIPILGVIPVTDPEKAARLRAVLAELGAPVKSKYFSVAVTSDGTWRVYSENDAGETVVSSVTPSREAAGEFGSDDAIFPVSGITIHGAQEQIAEYLAGAENSRGGFLGDDIDQAAWEKFLKTQDQSARKILLISPDPSRTDERPAKLKLSPGAAMQLILTWEQEHYRPGMIWNGYSEETIMDLKEWLDKQNPAYLKFAYAMRDKIAADHDVLDAAVFERYGVHLPETPNFFYADFSGSVAQNIQNPGFGNPAGGMTVSANFLTARKFHLVPPSTHTNAIALFLRKQLEQGHFIAWTQTIRELRAVYGDRAVQNTLVKQFGQAAWNNLKSKIETLAANGRQADAAVKFLEPFFREWTPSNIALNPSSILKQVAAGTAYGHYVPVEKLIGNLVLANEFSPEYRNWRNVVENFDPYLQNRAAGGMDPNLAGLLNYTRHGGKAAPVNTKAKEIMTIGTFLADHFSATRWGYAAFRYFYDLAVKNGYPETTQDNAMLVAAADKLAGDPIVAITSGVIRKGDGKTAIQNAMEWVKNNIAGEYETQAGPVVVDEQSAKATLSHTIYQNKLDALQAIPDILTRGAYLGSAMDKDGKPIDNFYFAAKVRIGAEDKIVFVRTRMPKGSDNRFYVHEVFTEDEIKKAGGTVADSTGMQTRGDSSSDIYRNILANVLNVKRETAWNFAMRMWKRATDETQQSGYLKDRNHFTSSPGLARALVSYMLSPTQTMGLEISALRKYLDNHSRENRNTLIRRFVVNHLIVSTSMNLVASLMRHGFNLGDYLDDWDDYVAGWLFGEFSSLWLFGKVAAGLWNGLSETDMVPLAHELSRDIRKIKKLGKNPDKADAEDMFAVLTAVGDVLMTTRRPELGAIGVGMHAGGRLLARLKKLVWPDPKNKESQKPKKKKTTWRSTRSGGTRRGGERRGERR